MFSNIVLLAFKEFIETNKLSFLKYSLNENYVILSTIYFDILVSYDEREDEIYIDFDIERSAENQTYAQKCQFPLYLSLEAICKHLFIQQFNFDNDKSITLQDRLKLKFDLIQTAWNELIKLGNYKEVLSDMLIKERNMLRNINESQQLKTIINRAKDYFKLKRFEEVVLLLNSYKEELNAPEQKILDYSIKKGRVQE